MEAVKGSESGSEPVQRDRKETTKRKDGRGNNRVNSEVNELGRQVLYHSLVVRVHHLVN